MKIIRKQDTYAVEKMFWIEKRPIQLWDDFKDNCIIACLDTDAEIGKAQVAFIDTVNGTETVKWLYESEIRELLWKHRKFINQSGQLDHL